MKIFLAIAGMMLSITALAQTPDPAKADTKKTPEMQAPVKTRVTNTRTVPQNPVPETPKPGPNSADYRLTMGKVTIYTGNDNKEQPSNVTMQLSFGNEGLGTQYTRVYKEFAVNSATELPFESLYLGYYPYEKAPLSMAENSGVQLRIYYSPNFPLDAWKIEKVVLTLEFRDGNGNLHPVLGTKNIVFTNMGVLLNTDKRALICDIDKFLMASNFYTRPQ